MVNTVLNLSVVIFGVIYYSFDIKSGRNIYGIFVILVLLYDLYQGYKNNNKKVSYGFLIYTAIAIALLPVSNTLSSMNIHDKDSRSTISMILYTMIFIIATLLSLSEKKENNIFQRAVKRKKSLIKILALIILSFILLSGIYMIIELFTVRNIKILEMIIPQYSFFFGLSIMTVSLLMGKIIKDLYIKKITVIPIILGITIFILSSVPFINSLWAIQDFVREVSLAYGAGIFNTLPSYEEYFLKQPFNMVDYLFGMKSEPYNIQEQVLFYEGTKGKDKGIRLYFDFYSPVGDYSKLPGKGSILIRIHGGAWMLGNKGPLNNPQVNKYFASQGYFVYDVQYGLFPQLAFANIIPAPENVIGDFSLDDMVRHLGVFTNFLKESENLYGGNRDSVFISGCSAGGQLSLVLGLGIHEGLYNDILNDRLNIRGIIPYYPANGLSQALKVYGRDEFINPVLLISKNSPPALIYQGTHDGLVNIKISQQIKNVYLSKDNNRVALLEMPYGGHSSDIYFPSYYHQPFIYFMERFMAYYK